MKQQIHTFPIWDSFESRSECPFCETLDETEESYISGMFRDMTVDQEFINYLVDNSFCSNHFDRLMKYRDKFGLALLLNHLLDLEIANLESVSLSNILPPATKTPVQKLMERFLSTATTKDYEKPSHNSCGLCQYLEERENDYMGTLIQLWKDNLHFRVLYRDSNGFCLNHFYTVVKWAPQILDGKDLNNFLDTSFDIQFQSMKQLNEDLKWFIKKFNYEYSDKPWNNSKDSLERSILKMRKKKDPL